MIRRSQTETQQPPAPARDPHARSALAAALLVFVLHAALTPPPAPCRSTVCVDSIVLRLNPNTASRDELMLIPGIGPALADAILEFRGHAVADPAFSRARDLDDVPRIGPATIQRMSPYLVLPDEQAGSEAPPP